jgi:hypothetical protein
MHRCCSVPSPCADVARDWGGLEVFNLDYLFTVARMVARTTSVFVSEEVRKGSLTVSRTYGTFEFAFESFIPFSLMPDDALFDGYLMLMFDRTASLLILCFAILDLYS